MIGELSDIDKKVVHSEIVPYLEHLADIGYIKSFRWLADYYKKNSNSKVIDPKYSDWKSICDYLINNI